MADEIVYLVHLRRPRRNDERTDPIYEVGSFGCTKCHAANLMHPLQADRLRGARLGFIQGGHLGFRLVFLTPPITIKLWKNNCEANWKPLEMPFKYPKAPVLARNRGKSDFRLLSEFACKGERSTDEGNFSSKFRSRKECLKPELAREVIDVYEQFRAAALNSAIASTYEEALPKVTKVDRHRKRTYQRLLRELRVEAGDASLAGGCSVAAEAEGRPRCSQRAQ